MTKVAEIQLSPADDLTPGGAEVSVSTGWFAPESRAFALHIAVTREDECDDWTAYCVELPGAISQHADPAEAVEMVKSLVADMLNAHSAEDEAIPIVTTSERLDGTAAFSIALNG